LLTKEERSDSSRLAEKAGQRPCLAIKYPPRPIVKVNKALMRLDSVPVFGAPNAHVSRSPQARGNLALMRGEA